MSRELTKQELHYLAMNIVGKDLEKRGFEFIAIESNLRKQPQFVCIDKKNQRYFVIAKAILLPNDPHTFDVIKMETFKEHAREHDAKVLYAGVGLGNPEGDHLPIIKDEEYLLEYAGIQFLDVEQN
ncbi:MAG: Na(+)-translocating NADH-quinone reductase subunit F [Bacteroidetes bacterium MedPE-SWsnd-G1]|nr:MAG: Na(+)-translocating NADH-quinone reductase subunit F [Bacteroidetes bacterium MedPE-SWsnd-G1]